MLVDDHTILRKGLRTLLELENDFEMKLDSLSLLYSMRGQPAREDKNRMPRGTSRRTHICGIDKKVSVFLRVECAVPGHFSSPRHFSARHICC